MDKDKIQKYLVEHELDSWLLADFHGHNTIATAMLGLTGMLTRRSFYLLPAAGEPLAIVHAIEKDRFQGLPGRLVTYSSYRQLEQELTSALSGRRRVAMEYSAMGRLPYIGLVDAGTVELVQSCGVEVVSSADLVAYFQARLSPEQIALHRAAAANLIRIKDEAFAHIAQHVRDKASLTEYDIRQFIMKRFDELGMETDEGPICAVDGHAGNPHYEPPSQDSAAIRSGQLILIDLWAKMKQPGSAFADITWMAYAGSKKDIPSKYVERFGVIARARDAAVAFLNENAAKRPVYGSEVDDVCRKVIVDAGYGANFTHRTGHSITTATHGTGPNIDNLETEDRRLLNTGHLFSIEPGVYFPDCGFRTEIDVLFGPHGGEVTTLPLQMEVTPLL